MNYFYKIIWIALPLVAMNSCNNSVRKNQPKYISKEDLIEANREKVGKEMALIDSFISQTDWPMKTTDTGLRYNVYHHGGGDSARKNMVASIAYKSFLLNGEEVGATMPGEVYRFRIGEGDAVTGLHEAVAMLNEGDSVRLILPSHLAYGLTGLQNEIPPNAAIFYDLCLVDLD